MAGTVRRSHGNDTHTRSGSQRIVRSHRSGLHNVFRDFLEGLAYATNCVVTREQGFNHGADTVTKEEYLPKNKNIIQNKTVLDLACDCGDSTSIIQELGAQHIYAVDAVRDVINKARDKIHGNVDFFVHDITDYDFLQTLVGKSQTIICLGVFYHLFDHFKFLSNILRPNIDHVLIETVCGPETINPEMFWGFEPRDRNQDSWLEKISIIPHGTPNLSWIVQSANIFGFEFDWIHYYGRSEPKQRHNITTEEYNAIAGPDWPDYKDIVDTNINIPEFVEKEIGDMLIEFPRGHRRMILRLYNSNTVDSNALDLKDHYGWPY
jgi:SAM-dependent methyltransferase